ncbi:MAG: histidine phosphatase family protein [Alphaproteobacteria bacterium]|nr:histidine phosphatase family protein [Alphaproteobacteria bacterium]MCB9974424.1 histidine phosphatase family protein [Rhodospirillales bacterium]
MDAQERYPALVEFYFMRHPQSEDNARRKANGHNDSRITEEGERQTDLASTFLEGVRPGLSEIHHSRMSRTFEAAVRLNEGMDLDLVENQAFDEQTLGDWEGVDWDEAVDLFESGEDPPGGEPYEAFHARIQSGLRELTGRREEEGALPLVISHGGVWMAIHKICGTHAEEWPENCDIYKVRITGTWDAPRIESEPVFRLPSAPENSGDAPSAFPLS